MVLIIVGTIGNFIDRLFRKFVIDFIEIDFFFYKDFPIFNVADMCLTVGVILLLADIVFGKSGHLLK
jgi:signal peptidase II